MAKTKTVNGQELPASAFLYIGDAEDTSTWKLPVKDASGEINLGRVAAAAAAVSPKGFRGKRVDVPKEAMGDIKRRLISMYKRLGKEKNEIPAHLYEQKSQEDPDLMQTDPSKASLGGSVNRIEETEYKGHKGLMVYSIMNSLGKDSYRDHAVLTPELKASTEKYFATHPLSMIQHGKAYRGLDGSAKPPVHAFMGFSIEHTYEDDGIHTTDFVPEPDEFAPQRVAEAYAELKAGEFNGVSVNGWFYRDTGLHQPPGIIIDWDLIEHSYCRNCVDQEAAIIGISEVKAKPDDEAEAAWNEMPPDEVHASLRAEFQEFKAKIDPSAVSPPDAEAETVDPPSDTVDSSQDVPPSEHKATLTEPILQPASGMDIYRNSSGTQAVASYVPRNDSRPHRQPEMVIPVSTPIQQTIPQSQLNSAEATDPATFGGNMNDVQTSGQNVSENDLIKSLLARVDAMEAERKAAEMEVENTRRDQEARAAAEAQARAIVEAEARQQAEFKAKQDAYLEEALARFQIRSDGGRLSMPVGATGRQATDTNGRPRYTMAGPVTEEKARNDGSGNKLPTRIIDWIEEVKYSGRPAHFINWSQKFGEEAKAVTMGVPGAQTNSPIGTAGGFALPVQYLEDIVPLLIDQFSIRSIIATYPANSILLEVPRVATRATRAVVTAEGDTKPKRQLGTDMIPIRLYTIPQIVDVSNQLLQFSRDTAEQMVRDQMADSIRLAEFYYALQGSGTNEPFGLLPALTAAQGADATKFYVIQQAAGNQPTGAVVPNTETLPDVIARAINVTQLRYYNPTVLLVHPNIYWKLIQTKDSYGRYLVDQNMQGAINSVWNVRVMQTQQLPMGKAVVGDFSKLRMYIAQDVTVDVSSEAGDRWDRNLTGFRIEEMIGLDARQELDAFTAIDFTTAGVASS
jgi:HK97 family phage major capsid protein